MDRCQDVLTNDTLVQHDSILIVVTLPRHISHEQVAAQGQLTILCSIAFRQDVTLLYTLAFVADRTQVNSHVLVGTTELRNAILLQSGLKADKLLILRTVIEDTDGGSVHIVNDAVTLSGNHRTRVFTYLTLNTCTDNRSFVVKQRYGLAHHVRSHQCTVSIVVLQERNQRCSNRCNLLGRNVHQVYLGGRNYREVCILTTLDDLTDKGTVVVQRSIALTDNMVFFLLGCQIDNLVIIQIGHTVLNLTIRSFDEAQFVNLGIDTQ